jgi:uncharacterized protein
MVSTSGISVRVVRRISEVDPRAWNALDHGGSPFLEHGFLRALEASRSVGGRSGWEPHYLLAEMRSSRTPKDADSHLVGAVAAFVKSHSYGEYIFDFAWAGASHRAQIPYFPKLVVAAPMTPATGPRLLVAPGVAREPVLDALVAVVRELADDRGCSSIHWLYITERERDELARRGFSPRASLQYHWHNRGYADFDDFLAALSSRKRKQLRKERARARQAVEAVELLGGAELTPADIDTIDGYYRDTVAAYGGMDYLRPGFFSSLVESAPERVLYARARRGGRPIAGALFLETERALYGRYWGAEMPVEYLHFELAYYVGIERCIDRGLPLFEAGAQGDHKLLRGFAPALTRSAHWIRHPGLARAIDEYVAVEARDLEARARELEAYLPYRGDR